MSMFSPVVFMHISTSTCISQSSWTWSVSPLLSKFIKLAGLNPLTGYANRPYVWHPKFCPDHELQAWDNSRKDIQKKNVFFLQSMFQPFERRRCLRAFQDDCSHVKSSSWFIVQTQCVHFKKWRGGEGYLLKNESRWKAVDLCNNPMCHRTKTRLGTYE